MANDEDGDSDITFTEFLHMDKRNDKSGTSQHPGFKLSAGILQTTKAENERLMKSLAGQDIRGH